MSRRSSAPPDVLALPLSGLQLIEAGAGTGKTHVLGNLYVRLIVETERTVDQILVLTFTKAATAELRERLRAKLQRVLKVFRGGNDDDVFITRLCAANNDTAVAAQRLTAAVAGFDLAAIHTIHGFCQQVLTDWPFAGGQPFDVEITPDTDDLLAEIARDFWRREVTTASPLLVDYLLSSKSKTPEALLKAIRPHVGKIGIEIRGADAVADCATLEQAYAGAFKAAAGEWPKRRDEIGKVLLNSEALKKNFYKKESIPGWLISLDEFFANQPSLVLPEKFEKFTRSGLAGGTKKDHQPPENPFFERCDVLAAHHADLAACFEMRSRVLRRQLLDYCNEEMETRLARLRQQSYDDLLRRTRQALVGPRGEALTRELRRKYAAALIDEFQDTDPLQYDIFRRLYLGTDLPLFLVGDPKQAIYGFRGADVYAYLQARRDAGTTHPLTVNWRSEPALVEAINAIFSFADAKRSFLLTGIEFTPATPAEKRREVLTLDGVPPFVLWFMPRGVNGKPLPKNASTQRAIDATAAEIDRLLRLSAAKQACFFDETKQTNRSLTGSDIAVLARTHKQAELIRNTLAARGIHSVEQSQESVFASAEAEELEHVLRAVAEPGSERLVRTALATPLLGCSGETLLSLKSDEAAWEEWLRRLHAWHELWRARGFFVMLRTLFDHESVPKRLLARADGERTMTNLLHLAELLQTEARHGLTGMEQLIDWLVRRRRAQERGTEETQLRLESDEQLVRIVTVHNSKGLEFPVVFCPFAWDVISPRDNDEPIYFHDPAKGDAPVLQFDRSDPVAQAQVEYEARAENLRLFYVALTRAKNRCYLLWGAVEGSERAAPAWLLHQGDGGWKSDAEAFFAYFKAQTDTALLADLKKLLLKAGGAIAAETLPEAGHERASLAAMETGSAKLTARSFGVRIAPAVRAVSYSSLLRDSADDRPDYDAFTGENAETGAEAGIHAFPRGARTGRCIHAIFEHIDFTDRGTWQATVMAELSRHGFNEEWTATFADMIGNVLATPLLSQIDLRLGNVNLNQRLNELEFCYPLKPFAGRDLVRLLAAHGAAPGLRQQLEDLHIDLGHGYMKGYIDLIFESGGRWYLADYKSNWLGPGAGDYTSDRLLTEMNRERYGLQYLIYTLALHRFLKARLCGYDYARHIGGVFYLFVRGMEPARAAGHGVFHDRPAAALIEALDALIADRQGAAA
jgi:exodeoxyribonuclease V beta subunit